MTSNNSSTRRQEEELSREESELWKSISKEMFAPVPSANPESKKEGLHPVVAIGLGAALLAHCAIIFSLPPVLLQRGAPFLPTASKGLNVMFQELKKQSIIAKNIHANKPLNFVDLGSGDGRVVFRAAREGFFTKSIGYEINPGELEFHSFDAIYIIYIPHY
jgi:hypothetical protein